MGSNEFCGEPGQGSGADEGVRPTRTYVVNLQLRTLAEEGQDFPASRRLLKNSLRTGLQLRSRQARCLYHHDGWQPYAAQILTLCVSFSAPCWTRGNPFRRSMRFFSGLPRRSVPGRRGTARWRPGQEHRSFPAAIGSSHSLAARTENFSQSLPAIRAGESAVRWQPVDPCGRLHRPPRPFAPPVAT